MLVPLALVGAPLIAFSARLRSRLGCTVAVIAVLGGLGAVLAAGAASTDSTTESPTPPARWMRRAVPAAAVVMLGVGGGATYAMVDAGHSGAKATWDDKAVSDGGRKEGYDDREHDRDGYRSDD